jgi:glutamyl-tRNA synthetase
LAVVVDDAEQQVTDVMRADDLFSSAARQELLYLALGKPSPKWAHIPLVVGADGRRLAKRHGDTTIRSFREAGRSADEVVGLLAFWSGLRSQPLPCRATDLLPDWALEKVPSEPVVWSGAWPDLSS